MISEENIKTLNEIAEKGKKAKDLLIEHNVMTSYIDRLNDSIKNLKEVYNVTYNNGYGKLSFDIEDKSFAAAKIAEILKHELELCKDKLNSISEEIEEVVK